MIRQYKKYIKDVATCYFIADQDVFRLTHDSTIKLRRRALSMLKNYCSFRLKLLQNKSIEQVEAKLIKALVKVAIKSAAKEFEIELPKDIDSYTDKALDEILPYVHSKRCDVFTTMLEIITDERP